MQPEGSPQGSQAAPYPPRMSPEKDSPLTVEEVPRDSKVLLAHEVVNRQRLAAGRRRWADDARAWSITDSGGDDVPHEDHGY